MTWEAIAKPLEGFAADFKGKEVVLKSAEAEEDRSRALQPEHQKFLQKAAQAATSQSSDLPPNRPARIRK